MARNMGTADRVIRIVLAIAMVGLFVSGRISGIGGIVLLVVAAVFLITSFAGRCPAYVQLHIKTLRS